MSNRLKQNM